jgi:hypothetical protein
MARKRPPGPTGPYTPGPYQAVREVGAWRVVAGARGNLLAVIHSRRPRGDAARIAAALDCLEGVPTGRLPGLLDRLCITVRDLADLLEGVELPVSDPAAYQAHVIEQARELLAGLNEPGGPADGAS